VLVRSPVHATTSLSPRFVRILGIAGYAIEPKNHGRSGFAVLTGWEGSGGVVESTVRGEWTSCDAVMSLWKMTFSNQCPASNDADGQTHRTARSQSRIGRYRIVRQTTTVPRGRMAAAIGSTVFQIEMTATCAQGIVRPSCAIVVDEAGR